MKKVLIVLVTIVLVSFLSAELMQPTSKKNPIEKKFGSSIIPIASNTREAPEFEFVTDPVSLITNYYDYMPGSMNGLPVQVQPDEFGGVYLVFHAKENAYATRREYYSYIDAQGNITTGSIGVQDIYEGYAGMDIDPVTGDPIVAWHVNSDGSGDLEVVASYDLFHVSSGLWITPFDVITNTIPSPNGTLDEFIWPYVHIGPSPEADKRRVYVQASNTYAPSDPSENPMIAYADFDMMVLSIIPTLEWTYFTIPVFDDWNQSNPEWNRPFHSFTVSKVDGRVAFFGYNELDEIYVCYNDNYGEGDWTYVSEYMHEESIFIPQNPPEELFWSFTTCKNLNSIFSYGSNKINFSGILGLQYDGAGISNYYPLFSYPYTFQYDFTTEEFSYLIQAPQVNENAANPDYEWHRNEIYIPWDTDNDGEVDEYDENGYPVMFYGWPIYHWDSELAFHENNIKMTSNDEQGWLINIWQDGLKSKMFNEYGDENYVDWDGIAEIYITISYDGGVSWSDPIIMNAKPDDVNYCEELAGMKPCYIYPSDKIEVTYDNWGLIHLMFLDDFSFGSFIQGHGNNLGGVMKYATLKIQFCFVSTEENDLPITNYELQNYPNPFNPSTTISFELTAKDAKNAKIEIFNLKGQKVDQLRIMNYELGINEVTWNAEDFASGVYFYQLKFGDEIIASKKCLLLK